MKQIKEWYLKSSSVLLISLLTIPLIISTYFVLKETLGTTESILIGIFFAITISGFLLILKVILNKSRWLESRIQNAKSEVQATLSINKFHSIPFTFEDYQASAQLIRHIIREIYLKKPNLILELGSGSSTSIIASCLMEIGSGKILSVEHDDYYASKTNELLVIEGVSDHSQVVTAPLKSYKLDRGVWKWYDINLQEHLNSKIDMLIIDGPPDKTQKLSRYPALPLTIKHLSKDCIIFLDDTLRNDEREILNLWEKDYGLIEIYENKIDGYIVLSNLKT
jgi:predicted O-methyltransferase YrrM